MTMHSHSADVVPALYVSMQSNRKYSPLNATMLVPLICAVPGSNVCGSHSGPALCAKDASTYDWCGRRYRSQLVGGL